MKRRLLWLAALLVAICAVGNASGRSTISWTQASGLCSVSDAYYITSDGQKAFIAGGLTAVPVGAEVYMTLTPVAQEGELMRLLPGGYVDMGGGKQVELTCAEQYSADTGAGLYSFVMEECAGEGGAQLVVSCVRAYGVAVGAADELTGGTVSVQDAEEQDIRCAVPGDIVFIRPAPDAQHVLDGAALAAVDAEGNALDVERAGQGGYSFEMPASDVTIAARFVVALPIEIGEGLNCEAQGDAAATGPLRAMPGSEVTLTISPQAEGMRIRAGSHCVTAAGQQVECDVDVVNAESGALSCVFVMPESAVSVSAGVGENYRARYEADIKLLTADGSAATAYCAGDELFVTVTVPEGCGLVDDRLAIAVDGGAYARQTVTARDDSAGTVTFMITAPAGDMAISAETGMLRRVTYTQPQGLGVIQTYPACRAAVGSRVTVALLPAEGWRVQEGSLTICQPGSHTAIATALDGSFIMPDSDCELSAVFEPTMYVLEPADGDCFLLDTTYSLSASGTVDAPVDDGVPCGALVSVQAAATGSCRAEGIYMQPRAASAVQPMRVGQGEQASFVMPAYDAVLYAVCADEEHVHPLAVAGGDEPAQESDVQTIEPAQSPEPEAQTDDALPYTASVTTDKLRLRELPATDGNVLGSYSTGERVEVTALSEDGEWAYVTVDSDGRIGWMKLEFVAREGAAEFSLPDDTPALNITIVIPPIEPQVIRTVEQQEENHIGRYEFRHILFL